MSNITDMDREIIYHMHLYFRLGVRLSSNVHYGPVRLSGRHHRLQYRSTLYRLPEEREVLHDWHVSHVYCRFVLLVDLFMLKIRSISPCWYQVRIVGLFG